MGQSTESPGAGLIGLPRRKQGGRESKGIPLGTTEEEQGRQSLSLLCGARQLAQFSENTRQYVCMCPHACVLRGAQVNTTSYKTSLPEESLRNFSEFLGE